MSNILLITQTEGQTKIDIVKNYGELKKISGWQKQLRDQISTDEIYPSKFAHKYEDLGAYALTGLEGKIIGENFLKEKQIEIIIAGENFGIGSSRIHAIQTLKDAGVKLIVAKSFYSVFRKNAINLAFPISENFDLLTKLSHFTTTELAMTKVEEKIIAAGGLINYLATSPKNPTKKNKKYSQTIAEKYLAKYANLPYVKPGEEIIIHLKDGVLGSYDIYGGIIKNILKKNLNEAELGKRKNLPNFVGTSCHLEIDRPEQKKLSRVWQDFCQEMSWKYFAHFEGVCHSIISKQFAKPGKIVLFTDSHTPHHGWLCYSKSVGADEMAALIAYQKTFVTVPKTTKIILKNKLKSNISIRDVAMHLMTQKINQGNALEYHNTDLLPIDPPELSVLTNIAVELGCESAMISPTKKIKEWYLQNRKEGKEVDFIKPDADANYDQILEIDLNDVEPMLAKPGSPQNVISIEEFKKTSSPQKINKVWIGSCVGGYQQEIERACQILQAKNIAAHTTIYMQPSHPEIVVWVEKNYPDLLKLDNFKLLGAACGACMGQGIGAAKENEIIVSTATRNFSGRNAPNSQIFLTSATSAAKFATLGYI